MRERQLYREDEDFNHEKTKSQWFKAIYTLSVHHFQKCHAVQGFFFSDGVRTVSGIFQRVSGSIFHVSEIFQCKGFYLQRGAVVFLHNAHGILSGGNLGKGIRYFSLHDTTRHLRQGIAAPEERGFTGAGKQI